MNALINTSKTIAILSFAIGTVLFVIQLYFNPSLGFSYAGFIFIIIATIINTISFLALIFSLLGKTDKKLELIKTSGLILLNIPIAILYTYILITYL